MAKSTKISSELQEKLNNMGINAKNEEQAKAKLLDILEENGIEGMEDEDLETLIEIAESFVEEGAVATDESEEEEAEEVEEQDETEEAEKLAEEAEAEEETEEPEEEDEAEEEEEETEEEEGDEFDEMERKELKAYIKEHGYDIKVTKSMSDDDLRDEIRNAVADEEAKKAAEAKKEVKKEAKNEKKETKRSVKKLDIKNNADDRKEIDFILKTFKEEIDINYLSNGGLTIKSVGKNGKCGVISLENIAKRESGIFANLIFIGHRKEKEEVEKYFDMDVNSCWDGTPAIRGVEITKEFMAKLYNFLKPVFEKAKKIDKKLGDNREKMEKELEKKAKPAAKVEKAPVKKTVEKKAAPAPAAKPEKKVAKKATKK